MFAFHSASLPRRLLVLAFVGLLPVVLFGVIALVLLARQQNAEIERASIQTTRAMISAVDVELQRSIAVLETLGQADSLRNDGLQQFYRTLHRTLRAQPAWITIVLADPSGRQRINAVQPFHPLATAQVSGEETFRQVVQSRRAAVGPVVVDPQLSAPIFTVHAPVVIEDTLRYVLIAAIEPQSMFEVIRRQTLPAGGLVTIFDQYQNVVARSRKHEEFVGRPVSEQFRELLVRRPEGWGKTSTLEGEPVYTIYSVSSSSAWGVGIGLPPQALDGPLLRSSLFLAAGILISLVLGVVGAAFVARRLSGPIQQLRAAALAIGRGERPAAIVTGIPELRDVADALQSAARDRDRVEVAREETLRLERAARALAEDANRMKDQFLAMFGHELRNPLAAIASAVQLMSHPLAKEESRQRAQAVLKRQTDHLARLVDDLLDVERIMTGKIELERAPLDLSEALAHALAALRGTGRLDRYDVSVQSQPVSIAGDATRVEQIITNLLINAVKYTPPDRRIFVTLGREGDDAVLRVRDEGVGIDRELLPKIFDLFVQGEGSLDRTQGGLGVGLTLVRRLVDLHGGTVAAESEGVGKGSVFTVRFPAFAKQAPVREAPASARDTVVARSVLLIEDNDDARIMMRHALEYYGHTVHEAADGTIGVATALAVRPDVAFIDLGLPGIDGYEVARRIRAALGLAVRLVALTGYGSPEDRRRSYEAGFDVHLVKPIDERAIEDALAVKSPIQYRHA